MSSVGKIQAGKLRQRIEIQSFTSTGDGQGGRTLTWSTDVTVWGSIQTIEAGSARNLESFVFDQLRAFQFFNVVIRYQGDLTTDMRLVHKGTVFEIESIVNKDVLRRMITLFCRVEG